MTAENTVLVKSMCQEGIQNLEQLLSTVKLLRGTKTDATQIDLEIVSLFHSVYRNYESQYERLPDEEPEPWYMDGLATISMDFDHADHVLREEIGGLYRFGWPWEEKIEEWTGILRRILERLS